MSYTPDQQPLTGPELTAARAAMTRSARYRTRAPKGVFYYSSHEEMAADRLRWTVDLMVKLAREGKILVSRRWSAESG